MAVSSVVTPAVTISLMMWSMTSTHRGSWFLFLVAVFVFTCHVPGTANAIDCFKCVSVNGDNPACEDPFHNNFSSSIFESPCMGGRKGRNGLFPATACIKLSGVYFGSSETIMVRGCALDSGTLTTDTEIIRMSHCGGFYYDDRYVRGCVQSCQDGDGCNGATKTRFNGLLIWGSVLLTTTLAWLTTTTTTTATSTCPGVDADAEGEDDAPTSKIGLMVASACPVSSAAAGDHLSFPAPSRRLGLLLDAFELTPRSTSWWLVMHGMSKTMMTTAAVKARPVNRIYYYCCQSAWGSSPSTSSWAVHRQPPPSLVHEKHP